MNHFGTMWVLNPNLTKPKTSGKAILVPGWSGVPTGFPGHVRAARTSELLGSSQGKVKMTRNPVQPCAALGCPGMPGGHTRIFEAGVLWGALGYSGVLWGGLVTLRDSEGDEGLHTIFYV
jgi:hypothetical protein